MNSCLDNISLLWRFIISAFLGLGLHTTAYADLLSPWKFLLDYQLGLEVGETTDTAVFIYHQPANGSYVDTNNCETINDGAERVYRCQQNFSKQDSNFGLFIEHPFKRQGLWHLDWDIGISLKALNGSFEPDVENGVNGALDSLRLNLYSLNAQPFITFGITPQKLWPDILVSLGTTGEMLLGSYQLDGQSYQLDSPVIRRSKVLSFSYWRLQIVFWRFAKGYLALNLSNSRVSSAVSSKPALVEDSLSGISEPDLELQRSFLGFQLLLK